MPNIGDAPSNAPLAGGYAKLTTSANAFTGTSGNTVTADSTWTEFRYPTDDTFRTFITPTYACVIVGMLSIPVEAQGAGSSPYRLDRNLEMAVGLDRVRAGAATPLRWCVRPDPTAAGNPPTFRQAVLIPFNLALTVATHEITVFARSSSSFTNGTITFPSGADKELGLATVSWIQIPT